MAGGDCACLPGEVWSQVFDTMLPRSKHTLHSTTVCLWQVVTVNDYLARRDSEWVGQVHRFLGLQVGLVQTNLNVSTFMILSAVQVAF